MNVKLLCVCFLLCVSVAGAQEVIEDSKAAAQLAGSSSSQLTDFRPAHSIVPLQTTGEAAGPRGIIPSNTKGYDGDPSLMGPNHNNTSGPQIMAFGADVHVRSSNQSTDEYNQCMASDSNGNLYVAWEDNFYGSYTYIQVYKSSDGGENWSAFGFVSETNVDLREPSIAIGEGAVDTFLMTYIRDDGTNIAAPEVATRGLSGGGWTTTPIPVWTFWEGYANPVINTDAHQFPTWYAYVTCEGIFDSASQNINVCTWRSIDQGGTWIDDLVLLGNTDPEAWIDPDQSYGSTQFDLFLTCYNDTVNSIYFVSSANSGATWGTPVAIYNLSADPSNPVDPEIAAAVNDDHIMVAFTKNSADDHIGYGYSKDLGATWSTLYTMSGFTNEHEHNITLTANEAGNSWHLAWTSANYVCYSSRPQSLSSVWSPWTVVSDVKSASHTFPKKGISSVWNTDEPCVCWADFREGDYDTYADFPENMGLACDRFKIECATGGSIDFSMNAGSANGNRYSLLFGGVTGYNPGTPLPGGAVLPINWDIFTNMVIELTNTPIFYKFYGKHNSSGKRTATLNVSPFTGAPSINIIFAYAVMDPWNYASNPVVIMIRP